MSEHVTLMEHTYHGPWKQVVNCVYCACGDRLYQGSVPKSEADRERFATAMDEVIRQAIADVPSADADSRDD